MTNSRTCAEHRQLRGRIFRQSPVRQIRDPDEHRAKERPNHLRRHLPGHVLPWEGAYRGEPDRDRGVEVRAADAADGYTAIVTATPHPTVMTSHPESCPFDRASRTVATTPSPSKSRIIVPTASARIGAHGGRAYPVGLTGRNSQKRGRAGVFAATNRKPLPTPFSRWQCGKIHASTGSRRFHAVTTLHRRPDPVCFRGYAAVRPGDGH